MKSEDRFFSELEPVSRQLQRWRRCKQPRERIPPSLWKAMVGLARRHGISRVCHALGIEYGALKRRLGSWSSGPLDPLAGDFIELPVSPPATDKGWEVELEDRSGAKMRLRLPSSSPAEALDFVQAFWRRGA